STLDASTTNSYGITVNANTGAQNNYAAEFLGGNVGIGTTSPFSTLSVAGNGYFAGNVTATNIIATGTLSVAGLTSLTSASTTQLTVSNSAWLGIAGGVVGIGTTSPFAKLSVQGDGYFAGNITASNITATNTLAVGGLSSLNGGYIATGSSTIVGNATTTGTQGVGSLFINNSLFSNLLGTGLSDIGGVLSSVWTQSGANIYNNTGGNVGIGTTSPFSTLSVAGDGYFSGNLTSAGNVTLGTNSANTVSVNGLINTSLIPNQNIT